jgi:hypothetical protein
MSFSEKNAKKCKKYGITSARDADPALCIVIIITILTIIFLSIEFV